MGTRGSPLALAQSRGVAREIEARTGLRVGLRVIRTEGDRVIDRPLPEIGGKGLFTAELDRALLEGEIDFAVHSLKDLPTRLEPGVALAAVPEREDARDVLVVRDGTPGRISALPRGARVGTSSVRRRALALALRPDLDVRPIRGNVDTRLRKLEEGHFDAVVLAAAGLRRLGLTARASHPLRATLWLPAPGQGALGIVARDGDAEVLSRLSTIEHGPSRAAVTFERTVLAALGGGCSAPVGAIGLTYDGGIRGWALVASPDGRHMVKEHRTGSIDAPAALGRELADVLVSRGAKDLLAAPEGAQADSGR